MEVKISENASIKASKNDLIDLAYETKSSKLLSSIIGWGYTPGVGCYGPHAFNGRRSIWWDDDSENFLINEKGEGFYSTLYCRILTRKEIRSMI